jgi:hypothetical protein
VPVPPAGGDAGQHQQRDDEVGRHPVGLLDDPRLLGGGALHELADRRQAGVLAGAADPQAQGLLTLTVPPVISAPGRLGTGRLSPVRSASLASLAVDHHTVGGHRLARLDADHVARLELGDGHPLALAGRPGGQAFGEGRQALPSSSTPRTAFWRASIST